MRFPLDKDEHTGLFLLRQCPADGCRSQHTLSLDAPPSAHLVSESLGRCDRRAPRFGDLGSALLVITDTVQNETDIEMESGLHSCQTALASASDTAQQQLESPASQGRCRCHSPGTGQPRAGRRCHCRGVLQATFPQGTFLNWHLWAPEFPSGDRKAPSFFLG